MKVLDNGIEREATEEEVKEAQDRSKQSNNITIPREITIGQGREALYNAGLYNQAQSAIDEIEDADTKWRIQNAWNNRPTWERESPFVLMMAGILGLDEEQTDQLFIDAAKL